MKSKFENRRYDIRPIDFLTGKRQAVAKEDMKVCACCGRSIVKIVELINGDTVGTECINDIVLLNSFPWSKTSKEILKDKFRLTNKQIDYIKSLKFS